MKKLYIVLPLIFVAVLNAQEKAFAPSGKFSGLMFGDYFYNADQHDASKKDFNGFQFRRIYFTYDYDIAEDFTTRFRLEADQSALASNGKTGVFVKDAYLRWKNVFQGSDLVFGVSPTPAYDLSEGAWGYRSLEKTIMDLRGIVPSRDLGIDLKGNLDNGGSAKYWLKIANNSGNSPESDKFKRYYGNLQFKVASGLQVLVYGDYDTRGNKLDAVSGQMKSNSRITFAGFVNLASKNEYSLGVEGYYQTIQNNFRSIPTAALEDQKNYGVTVFGWYAVSSDLRLVGRYDIWDPNTSLDKDGINLLILALDYIPANNVHVMPNLYLQTYQAGGSNDVVPRVTFYYVF